MSKYEIDMTEAVVNLNDMVRRAAAAAEGVARNCSCHVQSYFDDPVAALLPPHIVERLPSLPPYIADRIPPIPPVPPYIAELFPSHRLRRDLAVAFGAILLTFITMLLYNYLIDRQLAASKRARAAASRRLAPPANRRAALTEYSCQSAAAIIASGKGMTASGSFLSAVFAQLWQHMNPAVADAIKDALDPMLKDLKVPVHFVKVDLGDVPIRTSNMLIHKVDLEEADAGCEVTRCRAGVQIDVDVEWDGNCDITLQATLTKSAKAVFGVESIKVRGRMHILLSPLTSELPVVSAVQYGFTNPPEVDLSFTGAVKSVASLGFVQSALDGIIQTSLASMLVLPNRMVMPMDLMTYDYFDTYLPPVGMVRLTAVEARGFQVMKKMILKDIPDTYCLLSLGASRFRTSTQWDNVEPSWKDESGDFILYDMSQNVTVDVFDHDKGPLDPDDHMGKADISVREIFRQGGECEVELRLHGEKTGCYVTLAAELFNLSEHLESLTSPSYAGKDRLCGLATIIVPRAFDVPLPKKDAATYVKVVYGEKTAHEKVFCTGQVVDYPGYDALNPMYDMAFQVPLTAAMLQLTEQEESSLGSTPGSSSRRNQSVSPSTKTKKKSGRRNIQSNTNTHKNDISFTLIDGEGASGTKTHGELGKIVVTLDELLNAHKHTVTDTRPIGDGGAKMEFRVILSGIQSEQESLKSTSNSLDSQHDERVSVYGGIVENMSIRITPTKGRGFTIKKRGRGKKDDVPDVYCSICLVSQSDQRLDVWKTPVIKDDTMPRWNESKIFTNAHPVKHKVRLEAYDQEKGGSDDCLGTAEVSLELLLRKQVMEMELFDQGEGTGIHVTLKCVRVQGDTATINGSELSKKKAGGKADKQGKDNRPSSFTSMSGSGSDHQILQKNEISSTNGTMIKNNHSMNPLKRLTKKKSSSKKL